MKTNLKRVSKRSLALILGILMLFSTLMVGTITASAFNKDCMKGAWNWDKVYDFINGTCTISLKASETPYQFEVYFKDDGGKYIYPTTITDSTQTPLQLSTNTSLGFLYIKPSVTGDYTFTLDSTNKTLSVTFPGGSSGGGSTGGGDTPTYKLMENEQKENEAGTEAASFTGSGDTYTATYDITTTGKHYFYVRDNNKKDYLNGALDRSLDDGQEQLYQYGTSNYVHSIPLTVTTTGTYNFTFTISEGKYYLSCVAPSEPTTETTTPTETTSPTEATTPVTTTYYIAADEIKGWGEFRALTVGGNGTYSYYQNTSDTLTFKIAAQADWNGGVGVYGFTKVDNKFNASNVELTSSASYGDQEANIVCSVNPSYIIVYHPNTTLNKTDTPIICAATSLPSGGQQYSITTTNDGNSSVVVKSSAAEGETVSFSLRFKTGYEFKSVTVTGAEEITPAQDDTGTYSFTMPAHAVTIDVKSKASTVVVTNKYYIRGNVSGVGNWNSSAKMTISSDGFYEYYEVTDGSAAEFLIDKSTNIADGSYNYQNINSKFNGTNVAVTSKYSTDNGNKNVFVENATSAYYIIVYYPNTEVNTSNAPIICAATTKPSGLQQTVNVVAKDGTNSAKFAAMADTTIATSADVTDVTNDTDKEYATATAKAGKEITITTTIDATKKDDYLVKGWVVNGESVGIRSTDTATETGVYETTFTIDPLWIGDNGNLEITPVFFHTVTDTNKNDFIIFYVEDFNKGANETWGNTVACYPYYYTGNGTEAKEDFGAYPGQPMLKGAGDRYYVQIAKTCEEKAISGITLNNYHNDGQHATLSGTTANLQTYDYDDFVKILEAHPDATNIAFKFEYYGDYDNAPSTTSYGSTELITAAGKGGWEDLKNYNGDSLTNIFGKDIAGTKITPDTTKYLRVISNGYDSATGYIGQYATCWYVYAPNASGGWDYVTKIAPSALVFEDATALGNSDASNFVDAYNKLQQYSDYAVQVAYEGNATGGGSSSKRCDGKWYYTIKGQDITGNILIQYEKAEIANRGTYTYDNYTGTGVGEVTGANPHFTNKEATGAHTFLTTLDNDEQFTFTTDATSGSYKFVGWYILESEGAEPSFYTKDVDASAVRNKSFTFVARYNYVDEIAEIHITYNFKDFQAAEGEIAYTTEHNKALDSANSYTTNDTLIVAYVNDDAEIAKIVAKNAPMIHSDYYDYSLNNASITYSSIVKEGKTHVYATATMDDTPHVYSVTVNGQKFTGYYQNTLELYADEFGLTYKDATTTALWYLVDGTKETLYYDKFDLNYRFIVDKAVLKVVANDNNKSLDGESVIYNSYYELGYDPKDTGVPKTQKITQNFYITDYLDKAYDDNGNVIGNATNIKYVGGGIIYYSSDENGVATNDTVKTDLANKKAIINSALNSTYTADKNGTVNKVGYIYSKYDPAKFRYSEFLIAYQHIIGITLNNKDANAGKHISAYSFFVYTYQVGETTYTQIQISDTMAVATAYEPN